MADSYHIGQVSDLQHGFDYVTVVVSSSIKGCPAHRRANEMARLCTTNLTNDQVNSISLKLAQHGPSGFGEQINSTASRCRNQPEGRMVRFNFCVMSS